jgi:ABC-type ATPase with predicted acetyltransferase domain
MCDCNQYDWNGEAPALREWSGEGCGGVVWTRPVCPECGAEVHHPEIRGQPPPAHRS